MLDRLEPPVTRKALVKLVLEVEQKTDVGAELVEWLAGGDDVPVETTVLWRRFEGEDAPVPYVEITLVDQTLYVRTGAGFGGEPEIEIKPYTSARSAETNVKKRIASLARKRLTEVASVRRPLPRTSTRDERTTERERDIAEKQQQIAGLEEDAFEILREWESRGYDATRTFQAEGQRLSRDANAIANELVALVESHLCVTFTGMTIADEEHGVRGAIRARDVASFYMDAMHVLALAEEKISGDLQRDDGGWSDVSACVPTLTGIVERAFARLRPQGSEEKPKQTRPMAFGRGT